MQNHCRNYKINIQIQYDIQTNKFIWYFFFQNRAIEKNVKKLRNQYTQDIIRKKRIYIFFKIGD